MLRGRRKKNRSTAAFIFEYFPRASIFFAKSETCSTFLFGISFIIALLSDLRWDARGESCKKVSIKPRFSNKSGW